MVLHKPTNNSESRMKRGLELLEKGTKIAESKDGSFAVPSLTTTIIYEVRLIESIWVCTCPDFEYRHIECCKHIYAVRFWIATNTYLQDKPKPKVLAKDAISCNKCGSIRVVKYGTSANKQVFKCKDCQHKFREESLLQKVKFSPELITLTLDLYFSGLSLRKIARNVGNHFDIQINFSTIYTWIQRYIPVISNYVNSLKPQLGETWHADELFVKMKGGETRKGNTGIAYLWNIMDRQSRFLIASKLSEHRDTEGAINAFNEAIHNAHGQNPQQIHTDALRAYREGISKTFGLKVDHVSKCGINKPHADNNRAERLNGTLRERVKVQRGWKSHKSAIAEGQRIQYNFVKPHMALEGQQTPAKKAGIESKGKNKWKDLLEFAIDNKCSK
jgi:putative transposase